MHTFMHTHAHTNKTIYTYIKCQNSKNIKATNMKLRNMLLAQIAGNFISLLLNKTGMKLYYLHTLCCLTGKICTCYRHKKLSNLEYIFRSST